MIKKGIICGLLFGFTVMSTDSEIAPQHSLTQMQGNLLKRMQMIPVTRSTLGVSAKLTATEQQQLFEELVNKMSDLIVTAFAFMKFAKEQLKIQIPVDFDEKIFKSLGEIAGGMITLADELEGLRPVILSLQYRMACLKRSDSGNLPSCKKLNCTDKLTCLQGVIRELFGSFEFFTTKKGTREKYENKGVLDPLFDVLFSGYYVKGQERRGLVPLIFDTFGLPKKTRDDVVLAVNDIRKTFRLVATLTLEVASTEDQL